MAEKDEVLNRAVGLADCCELMFYAFSFPDERFTGALHEGDFSADVQGGLLDAGASSDAAAHVCAALQELGRRDVSELMGALRKGHSALYLAPGAHVPVSPYESAFVYFSEGNKGVPILFRSPLTLDVERHMREAGVMPKDARREPSDSVWNEFSFLSYLYGSLAAALHEGRGEDVALWRTRLAAFWNEHASRWLPAFMEQTQEMAPVLPYGEEYAIFAEIGQMILEAIASDVAACAESRLLEDIGSPNDLTAN